MSDMKTYLEQNACDRENILTHSVTEPKSWDEVATAIKSAIFDYLDLNRDMLKGTNYLYVGVEALWVDPHKEATRFHLGIPVLPIRECFSSLPTRDFEDEILVPNAKRLILMLKKAGFDEPTMSSGVTVFVAEINRQELTPANDIVISEDPMHHISVKNRRLNVDNSPVDAAVFEFVFRYNLKVDGLSDEEIAEKWEQSPWCKKPDITNHNIE